MNQGETILLEIDLRCGGSGVAVGCAVTLYIVLLQVSSYRSREEAGGSAQRLLAVCLGSCIQQETDPNDVKRSEESGCVHSGHDKPKWFGRRLPGAQSAPRCSVATLCKLTMRCRTQVRSSSMRGLHVLSSC